ncbi:MAG: hypothetical protein M1818_006502 [Claussenomyces sp. TS43310]|nr:MAG: hypothetical protein M1818_006502 [Claussenomyces sp. TS43310]
MPAGYASRDVPDPSQMKKNKQSMADLKLRRLTELNNRLREDLERERIPVSQAARSIIAYTNSTKDFMVPSFAQELLSTFGAALGEVALQPSTGGTFVVEIFYSPVDPVSSGSGEDEILVQRHVLWDRKVEGGFPETKELKRRVRDVIEPDRDLGHVDRKHKSLAPDAMVNEEHIGPELGPIDGTVAPPRAISQLKGQEGERKFTPMDVDSAATKETPRETKRNPDGSICEDCN